jgi:o-succinylbenzoate---CoA ligase
MESEEHIDSAKWQDRFENYVTYFLSSEDGISSISKTELRIDELAKDSSYMLVKTSGSSGKSKWVVHSKVALLKHAALVNDHLRVTNKDVFGLMIPAYHVGGLGVIARSLVSEAKLVCMKTKWSARSCVDFIVNYHVTVVSLVPTQLVDILADKLAAPECLRVLVVGGGKLDSEFKARAVQLGWPVFESYGMTETGSQIATDATEEHEGREFLQLIDGWQVRLNDEGILEVKGDCLFKGYFVENSGVFEFIDPRVDGWFTTSDRAELLEIDGKMSLKFLGRSDQKVKILGELVDISDLELRLTEFLKQEAFIIPVTDERRGMKLFPVVERECLADKIKLLNWSGLQRLEDPLVIKKIPRNEMGKLQRFKLVELVESIVISAD